MSTHLVHAPKGVELFRVLDPMKNELVRVLVDVWEPSPKALFPAVALKSGGWGWNGEREEDEKEG